jgi:hypothetical protein
MTVDASVAVAPVVETPSASTSAEVTAVDTGAEVSSDEPLDGESFEDFKARREGSKKKGKKEAKEAEPETELKLESEESGEATETAETEAKEKTEFEPVKLKYGDEEIEITSMDELTKIAQKGLGAERKFQEAASIRKSAEKLVATLKDNPIEILRHPALRDKMLEAAQELIFEQIQSEQMTAEERSRLQEKEELERYRRSEQERKAQDEAKQREDLKNKYRQDYERQFIEALNAGGIPKSDWAVTRMAQYMRQALQKGMTNITPADVAHMVKRDWQQAQSELYGQLDGDKLIEMLGPDIAEKIRKADVAKLTSKRPQQQPAQRVESVEPKARRRFSSPDQMLESL